MEFKIGDAVIKKSGKPFKHGEKDDIISEFTLNLNHPNKVAGALLKHSDTIVSLQMLMVKPLDDLN